MYKMNLEHLVRPGRKGLKKWWGCFERTQEPTWRPPNGQNLDQMSNQVRHESSDRFKATAEYINGARGPYLQKVRMINVKVTTEFEKLSFGKQHSNNRDDHRASMDAKVWGRLGGGEGKLMASKNLPTRSLLRTKGKKVTLEWADLTDMALRLQCSKFVDYGDWILRSHVF